MMHTHLRMMMTTFLKCRTFCLGMIACLSLLTSQGAKANNISFDLSLTGTVFTLTHKGDATAFYPGVFRLSPDGHWEPLANASATPSAEFLPGTTMNLVWPEQVGYDKYSPALRAQPVMIRFFDQAGVGFGQISFFAQPPESEETLNVRFVNGKLAISPPKGTGKPIRSSWLLWPKEDGIGPIHSAVKFEHSQPPATHIQWRPGMGTVYVDAGAGLPATVLLHETDDGVAIQRVPGGGLQGREQRAAWLDGTNQFYWLALAAALAAAMLIVWQLIQTKRGSAKA